MATRTVQVKGLRELGQRMQELAKDVAQNTARRATAAAANVIKKGAKRRAPVAPAPYVHEGDTIEPGNVGKQIVTKRVKPSETDLTSEHLVVVRGKKKYGYASRIGALKEFGTVKMPADPFMRPALEEDGDDAITAMTKRIASDIEKANKP